jgi:hypothetical protein
MFRPILWWIGFGVLIFGSRAYGQLISPSAKRATTEALRERAHRKSSGAILMLGLRNDTASIPMLKEFASQETVTAEDLKACLHADSLMNVNRYVLESCQETCRNAIWSAKAALTKMGVQDHFSEFAVQLATTNPNWRIDIINYLGYVGDQRAVQVLGPLLLDDSQQPPWGHMVFPPTSFVAADAMGNILQPPFMINDKTLGNPGGHRHVQEWKQWWLANRAKYGDTSPLPADMPSTSPQISILRQTEKTESVSIGSDGGTIQIRADAVQVDFPSGNKTITAQLLMAMAPSGGVLWWNYEPSTSNSSSDPFQEFASYKLYATSTKLLAFQPRGSSIIISEGSARYSAFADALTGVLPTIQKNIGTTNSAPVLPTRSVDLWKVLGQGFFMSSASQMSAATISGIVRKNSQWIISLQGQNNSTASVTLASDYKMVSATLNGKAVYP